MNKKELKVVILPQSYNYICKGDIIKENDSTLIIADSTYERITTATPMHMYWVSDEPIEYGDYFLTEGIIEKSWSNNKEGKWLNSFIKEYCRKESVEWSRWMDTS